RRQPNQNKKLNSSMRKNKRPTVDALVAPPVGRHPGLRKIKLERSPGGGSLRSSLQAHPSMRKCSEYRHGRGYGFIDVQATKKSGDDPDGGRSSKPARHSRIQQLPPEDCWSI